MRVHEFSTGRAAPARQSGVQDGAARAITVTDALRPRYFSAPPKKGTGARLARRTFTMPATQATATAR